MPTTELNELLELAEYVLNQLASLALSQTDWPDVKVRLVISHS